MAGNFIQTLTFLFVAPPFCISSLEQLAGPEFLVRVHSHTSSFPQVTSEKYQELQ